MSSIGMVLAWCPGQTPPSKCDPCAPVTQPPLGGAWPIVTAPHLKTAYFEYPQLFLWNQTDYQAMVKTLSQDAGGYIQTAHSATFSATKTAKFTYPFVPGSELNPEYFLVVSYSFSPDPTPKFPLDAVFSVTGTYKWIGYQIVNAGYLATIYTDPVVALFI